MRKLPSTPKNTRIYAVGDIHGRMDLLAKIIYLIEKDAGKHPDKEKKLIFLGDYVDRGLYSRDVIERLTKPFANGLQPTFLRGNHEEKLIAVIGGNLGPGPSFLKFGGDTTAASYGVKITLDMKQADIVEKFGELSEKMPAHHHAFLNDTKHSVSFGDYYFVHAGARPGVPLTEQKPADQLWIRDDFMSSKHKFEKMIIHGHTITESKKPEVKPNRIGIDTGAYATGQLTCLILDGTKRMTMQTMPFV